MKKLYHNRNNFIYRFILPIFLALLIVGPVQTFGSTLPPKAQVSYERGFAAAEQGEWGLAVEYFNKAQRVVPGSSEILFNLALACSNAGGRDVLAIAWFRAYLAVDPDAANAVQVRKEILGLEVRVEATVRKLFRKANDTAAMVVDNDDKAKAYGEIVYALLQVGDIAGAGETAALIPDTFANHSRFTAYSHIAKAQADAGFFNGAIDTATLLEDGYKGNAYRDIASAQVKEGDTDGARKTASMMKNGTYERASIYHSIVLAQVGAGDMAGARKTAGLITYDGSSRPYAFRAIAREQVKAGDISGAMETAAIAGNVTERDGCYRDIAEAQAGSGNIDGAMETASLITDNSWEQVWAYNFVVKARALSGDMAGAREVVDGLIGDPEKQYIANEFIAVAQVEAGGIEDAMDTAGLIDNGWSRLMAYEAIIKAQIKTGDLDGARLSAALAGNENKRMAEIYIGITNTRLQAGDKRGAAKSFVLAMKEFALVSPDTFGDWVNGAGRTEIIEVLAAAGDIVLARKMASLVPDPEWKAGYYYNIAKSQIEAGGLDGARETAALIEDGNINKSIALQNIVRAQAMPDPEVKSRVALAEKYHGKPLFDDLQKFLKSLTARESWDVARELADAAMELTEALKEIMDNSVK